MATIEETQQQLAHLEAALANLQQQVTAMGLPPAGAVNTVPKCQPARPEDKLAIRAARVKGAAWHPQLGSKYTPPCRGHGKAKPAAFCADCWTPEREHHEKYALGLCDCLPEPAEEPTRPQTATSRGDVYIGEVVSPQTRRQMPRRGGEA